MPQNPNAPYGRNKLQQLKNWILYLSVSSISFWATSESVYTSFALPRLVSYGVGLIAIAMMATMITLIKKRKGGKNPLIIGLFTLVFAVVLGLSVYTNSHKFFTQLKIQEIRYNELGIATNELQNIQNNSRAIGNRVINDYQNKVTSRIKSYESEVANPNNCGHGPQADSLKRKVEALLPGANFLLPSGSWEGPKKCRELANIMGQQMTRELSARVESMRSLIDGNSECENKEEIDKIVSVLEDLNTQYYQVDQQDVRFALSRAHLYYNKLYDCLNNKLILALGSLEEKELAVERKLKMPVPSVNLEKISELWPFVIEHKEHMASFFMALLLALVIDVGALTLFYFMVLQEEEEYF